MMQFYPQIPNVPVDPIYQSGTTFIVDNGAE